MHPSIQKYLAAVATANGQDSTAKLFNVQPQISRKMRGAMRLSSEFLKRVNTVGKDNVAGEIIGIKTGLTASRTGKTPNGKGYVDFNGSQRRQPKTAHAATARRYLCQKINFDIGLGYEELDAWAAEPEYVRIINEQIVKSKAESLLSIAFNGKEWADNSDLSASPLLQDCGKGWLWQLRTENALRVLGWESGQVGTTKKAVKYGSAQEYKSLDAVVIDAANSLIAEEYADRADMVVICSRRTLGDKYFTLVNAAAEKASEVHATDILASTRRLGGLQAIAVPYFPADTLLITPLANLSIYFHNFGHRRKVVDEPDYDRIANYESENIDFVVEEYEAAVLIDNIEHVPA
jgi:P2 family phage major capsid protein